jgi:PKD repeat protein
MAKKWKTENFRIRTLKGNVISGKYYQYLAPSNTQKGTLRFVPDTTLTDSIIQIQLVIKDMGPYYCDSTINKFIFVAPRPQPDFVFNKQICDGDAVLFENQSRISSGNMRYKWYFGTGNPEDTSDAFSTIFKFPAYGKYKVSLTATSIPYGYETTKTILVEVTEIPRIDFKILNACENIPLRFINNTSHTDTVSYFGILEIHPQQMMLVN